MAVRTSLEKKTQLDHASILLVEDDPDHAELVIRSLKAQGFANSIELIRDGESALDFLFHRGAFADRPPGSPPALILLDLRLPRLDGLQVLKELKAHPHLEKIPVVILTTSAADRDLKHAYRYHVNSYLLKPVDFHEFEGLMRELGFYWLLRNVVPAAPDF